MSISRFLFSGSLMLLFALTLFSQSKPDFTRLDGKSDESAYRQMVEKIKGGDDTVDFVKFRAAYLEWSLDECNVTESPDRDAFVAAYEAKEYEKALAKVDSVLDYEYANYNLHRAVANAYTTLGNAERAAFHTKIADKLIDGLMASGDGKSAKTGYRVHSIREEYFVMRKLGYAVSSQALSMDKEYGVFDILTGKDSSGKTGSFYFNITDVWVGSTSSKPCAAKKTTK